MEFDIRDEKERKRRAKITKAKTIKSNKERSGVARPSKEESSRPEMCGDGQIRGEKEECLGWRNHGEPGSGSDLIDMETTVGGVVSSTSNKEEEVERLAITVTVVGEAGWR